MTNIFKRFFTTVEAEVNFALDKKESKNPAVMLTKYLHDAEKQVTATGKLLARQAQLKSKLEQELATATTMLTKREAQLKLAEQSDEQDLIAFAAQEVSIYQNRKATLEDSITLTASQYLDMERRYEEMKHKIKDMRVRQLQLMGKENVTRANHTMNNILLGKADSALQNFESAERYIDNLAVDITAGQQESMYEYRLAKLQQQSEKVL
ncbi:Phage shock protein A [Metalysinibacillus saudimassiliensis]|uniref:Phage shock protein A n=1 Tax=Metalysinibacillus saudimassiliensis TaxID=1461583 RepID=A0A078MJ13_9BACL|nr:Phage shock protein A [Metalysinibacillus saudimassiliensis]